MFQFQSRTLLSGSPRENHGSGSETRSCLARRITTASAGTATWRLVGWLVLILSLSTLSVAQESTNSGIVGRVVDSTGASVSGVKVIVTSTGTGTERSAVTDEQGNYSVSSLPPSNYRMKFVREGFSSAVVPPFDLKVGAIAREDIALAVGAVNTTVEVTDQPPVLESDSASIDQGFETRQIVDLPLNGRNVLDMAGLSTGVITLAQTSGAQGANAGGQFGSSPSRNEQIQTDGGRASSTNYVMDGVYVRSLRFNNMAVQPSLDALQEFKIIQSAASAEYGQGQSVVTMVTKGGGNSIHGSAYEFVRNTVLNAQNRFADPSHKSGLQQNQFGLSLGAPVIKNKAFLFGAWERYDQRAATPSESNVADPAQITGDFRSASSCPTDPLTGLPFGGGGSCIIPSSRISAVAKLLNATYPKPNFVDPNGHFNFVQTNHGVNTHDTVAVRGDQSISDKQLLFERYVYYNSAQLNPGFTNATTVPQSGQNLSIGHTYILTPTMTNEVRLGWNYDKAFTGPLALGPNNYAQDLGFLNLVGATVATDHGRPNATIIGPTTYGAGDTQLIQGGTENLYSANDTVSFVRGKHTIRTGIQYQDRRFSQSTDVLSNGNFIYLGLPGFIDPGGTGNAMANYVIGHCFMCMGQEKSSLGHYSDSVIAPFAVDTWQMSNKLTVVLGLRYEYASPFKEKNNLEGAFDPATGKIGFHVVPANIPASLSSIMNTTPEYPAGIISPVKDSFGPRVGLAYRATNNTVVRSGFGIFFDNTNLNELQLTRATEPFTYVNILYFQDQNKLFPDPQNMTSFPAPFSANPKNRYPYSEQWNLSIQHQFAGNWVFETAYTGSESHKLSKRYDQNQPLLNSTTGQQVGPSPYPQFATGMLTSTNQAFGNFHGLSGRLEKQLTHGFYYQSNIQWSKTMDNGSGEIDANDTAYSNDFRKDYGLSAFHTRLRSSNTASYELPFGTGKMFLNHSGLANTLAGGWQVNGTAQFVSGFYLTPTQSSANSTQIGSMVPQRVNLASGAKNYGNLGSKANANKWYDPTDFAAVASGQGTVGRDVILGPRTTNVNFSAMKNFKLFEQINLQFRGEVFNLFNHPNLFAPNVTVDSSTAGVISGAADPRVAQFALKLGW